MNVIFQLTWEPALGATTYQVSQLNANGSEDLLVETEETSYEVAIDDSTDHAFLIRAWNGQYHSEPVTIVYTHAQTLGDLRDAIRAELKDPSKKKYTDTELENHLRDAVKDYSKRFPKPLEMTLPLAAGQMRYALPESAVVVERVEYVAATGGSLYLVNRPWKSGEADLGATGYVGMEKLGLHYNVRQSRVRLGHWDFRAPYLDIDFPPNQGDRLELRYGASYTVPPFAAVRIDVPAEDQEMLKLYAKGLATIRIEGQDANLSRWTEGQRRDDNPMTDMTNRYMNAYMQRVREKQDKPKMRRRVRE